MTQNKHTDPDASRDQELQELLRLKRCESPPDGYFDGFLAEFHRRQRAELLQRSARGIFFERVATYFSGLGGKNWFYAAGGVYALVMLGLLLRPAPTPETNVGIVSGADKESSLLWRGEAGALLPTGYRGGGGSGRGDGTDFLRGTTPPEHLRPRVIIRRDVLTPLSETGVVPTATEL